MKLLVSDYDLTLNAFDYDVRFNMHYIEKFRKKGNLFFLNTGRGYESIMREISKYRINFDYLGCCDGNLVLNRKNEIVHCTNLSSDILEKINSLQKKYGYFKTEVVRYKGNILEYMIVIPSGNFAFWNDLNNLSKDENLLVKKFGGLIFDKCKLMRSDNFYVGSNDISKSSATNLVSQLENISKCDIFTIGDHLNDLEMVRDFNGYTLPWSRKEVKMVSKGQVMCVASLVKKIMR